MSRILVIFIFLTIQNLSMEEMLGKNITQFSDSFVLLENDDKGNTYLLKDIECGFLSKSIDMIIVKTDTKNVILSVLTDFNRVIDKEFYDEMVDKFGDPTYIYRVADSEQKEIINHENGTQITSQKGKLEKCRFEDKPLFIRWQEKDYQIDLTLYHKKDETQLNIRKKSNDF
ncbi:hypothetical protein [Maribacter arenosus]|uniref:Uncharacterized protein n=1 Tax=Maribacter arenosus TaxID=1854708 RepID=A0ABR7V9V9_9FLAO|nr:hypothetical protein [Maribacter arenosus]MBD0850445.1 hypothetical protein [Maribacter arenosus]